MNIHTEELCPSSSKSKSEKPRSQIKSEYLRKSGAAEDESDASAPVPQNQNKGRSFLAPVDNQECSVRLYNEFMNCDSFLYTMPERENLESISSDGELNDFKKYTVVEQDHHMFVKKEYKELVQRKYQNDKK